VNGRNCPCAAELGSSEVGIGLLGAPAKEMVSKKHHQKTEQRSGYHYDWQVLQYFDLSIEQHQPM